MNVVWDFDLLAAVIRAGGPPPVARVDLVMASARWLPLLGELVEFVGASVL
ncbi:MAG TPA: hypothetical protein VGK42_03395 [Candidatus Dormibacteraeota bacterium]